MKSKLFFFNNLHGNTEDTRLWSQSLHSQFFHLLGLWPLLLNFPSQSVILVNVSEKVFYSMTVFNLSSTCSGEKSHQKTFCLLGSKPHGNNQVQIISVTVELCSVRLFQLLECTDFSVVYMKLHKFQSIFRNPFYFQIIDCFLLCGKLKATLI